MTIRILMPLAEGFEEIEAVAVIDILRRAGIEVVTAGLKEGMAVGSHKIVVQPDTSLNKIDFRDFDGLVLPGGAPGFVNLGNDERILKMAREMDRAERSSRRYAQPHRFLSRPGSCRAAEQRSAHREGPRWNPAPISAKRGSWWTATSSPAARRERPLSSP